MSKDDLYLVVKIDGEQIDGSTDDLHATLANGPGSGVLTIDGMAFDVGVTRITRVSL